MRPIIPMLTISILSGCLDEPAPDASLTADVATELDPTGTGAWQTVMEGDWALEPDTEAYFCLRRTLEADMYIAAFEAIASPGTHHTVLTIGEPSGPDGLERCTSFTNQPNMIYGSGTGTNTIELPDGVAVRVHEGQQLLLNLHLFNLGDAPREGTSGIRVRAMAEDEPEHIAQSILAGPLALDIPPGRHVQRGACTFPERATVIAAIAHMHQLGTHMKVTAKTREGDVVLHDEPYDFDEQQIALIDPVTLDAGDTVEVECSYDNTTGRDVGWGESTRDEMCFAGLVRYPASDAFFVCSE
jgi:hypothetical protein